MSFFNLSTKPGYMVLPPEKTKLAYKVLRMFISHCMMEVRSISGIMNTTRFLSQKVRMAEYLWAMEILVTNGYHVTIRQFIRFLQ